MSDSTHVFAFLAKSLSFYNTMVDLQVFWNIEIAPYTERNATRRHFSIKTFRRIIYRGNRFQGFGKYSTLSKLRWCQWEAHILECRWSPSQGNFIICDFWFKYSYSDIEMKFKKKASTINWFYSYSIPLSFLIDKLSKYLSTICVMKNRVSIIVNQLTGAIALFS